MQSIQPENPKCQFIEVTREVVECGPDPDEVVAANMVATGRDE